MLKNFRSGWEVVRLSYKANGIWAIISIFSSIYNATLFPFIQIFLLAKLIDLLTKQQLSIENVAWIVVTYLIATIVQSLLENYFSQMQVFYDFQFDAYLDLLVAKKLTELDPATFENPQFQNTLSQIDGLYGSMQALLSRFVGVLNASVKLITALIILLPVFPLSVVIIILATIPSFIASNHGRELLWPYFDTKKSALIRLSRYIKTLLSSDSTSKEAIIFKTGHVLQNKMKQAQLFYLLSFHKSSQVVVRNTTGMQLFQLFAFVCTQYINLAAVIAKQITVGNFSLYFQQTLSLANGAEEILEMYSSISMRSKYVDKFFDFINTQPQIQSPKNPVPFPTATMPPTIEFINVSFKYPGTERYILQNFNIKIASGEKIALVGENGAGKTTLIKLILRFYDVTAGDILINGINIKELSLEQWHEHVGALFQDFIKYQFTFKENVYFGSITKKQEEQLLREAIEQSGADKYLGDLPKGVDQVVGKMFDEGIDLSGGQWQKLALARAFYRNAPILILDEPTASIDAKAEYEIFEKVQKLQKDKTVIIISHRFSTVRNADRILVLDEGKIVESGNHEFLMKEKGLYAELFELQAKGYK